MDNREIDSFVDFTDCDDTQIEKPPNDTISHFNVINPTAPTLSDIVKKHTGEANKKWVEVGMALILLVAYKYEDLMKCEQINVLVNKLLLMKSFVDQIKTIEPNITENRLKIYALAFFMCIIIMAQQNCIDVDLQQIDQAFEQKLFYNPTV